MSFTAEEIEYLTSQPLCRLATVGEDGQPDAVPLGLEWDGTFFYVGGHGNVARTRKVRNVAEGRDKVAFVVDDLVSTNPWTPRFVRVYGRAEVVEREGMFGEGVYLRIAPEVSWSWNLDAKPFGGEGFGPRRTVHAGVEDRAGSHRPMGV